jgi:hypothetical protein
MAQQNSAPQPSPNQLSQNYDSAAVYNNLVAPDWFQSVYGQSGGFNVLTTLTERIRSRAFNGAQTMPRKVEARLGQFYRYVLGQMVVSAQIATSTQSGVNVILTFSDPTYSFFRTDDTVQNNTSQNINARVISPNFTPGTITLAPVDDSTPLNASDWAVGTGIVVIGNAQPYSSNARASIYQLPFPTYNYTQTFRETITINRLDTYLTYPKDSAGRNMAYAQFKYAEMYLANQLETSAFFGVRGLSQATDTRTFGGLDWAINDPIRGGVSVELVSYPTQQDFYNYWNDIAGNRNQQHVEMIHLCGRGYLGLIQQLFTQNQIQYAGTRNTLELINGELVKGFDTYTFAAQGITHIFVHAPLLNNNTLFPNYSKINGLGALPISSYSCYTIDTGTFMDSENNMILPSMEQLYFGTQPITYNVVNGMAPDPFGMGLDSNVAVATAQDANQMNMIVDTAWDFMAKYMGCMKLAY